MTLEVEKKANARHNQLRPAQALNESNKGVYNFNPLMPNSDL